MLVHTQTPILPVAHKRREYRSIISMLGPNDQSIGQGTQSQSNVSRFSASNAMVHRSCKGGLISIYLNALPVLFYYKLYFGDSCCRGVIAPIYY